MDGAGGYEEVKKHHGRLVNFTDNTLARGRSGLREYRTVKSFLTTLALTPPTQTFTKAIGPYVTKIGLRKIETIPNTKRNYRLNEAPDEYTFVDKSTGRVYVMDKVFKQLLRWDNPYTMYRNGQWLDWIQYFWNSWVDQIRNQVFKMVYYSPHMNVIMYHKGKIDYERDGGYLKVKRYQCFRPLGMLTYWSWEKLALMGFVGIQVCFVGWELVLVFYYYMRVMNICGCSKGLRSQKIKDFWDPKNQSKSSSPMNAVPGLGLGRIPYRPPTPLNPMLVGNFSDDQPESPAHLRGSENQDDRNLDSKVTNDDPLYDLADYMLKSQGALAQPPKPHGHTHAQACGLLQPQEMLDNLYSLCPIEGDIGNNQGEFEANTKLKIKGYVSHRVLFLFQKIIINNSEYLKNRVTKSYHARILILCKLLLKVFNGYHLLTLLTLVMFFNYFTLANSYHSLVKFFQEDQFKTDYLDLFSHEDMKAESEWYKPWDHATSTLAYNWNDQRYILVYLMILSWISMLWISQKSHPKPRKFFKVFRSGYFLAGKFTGVISLVIIWAFIQALFCNVLHGQNVDGLYFYTEVLTLSFKALNMDFTLYYLVARDSKLQALLFAILNYFLVIFGLLQICRAHVVDTLRCRRKKQIISPSPFDYPIRLVDSISNICGKVKVHLRKIFGCCTW